MSTNYKRDFAEIPQNRARATKLMFLPRVIYIQFNTGLRISEFYGWNADDIDFDEHVRWQLATCLGCK